MKESLLETWMPLKEIDRDASIEMAYKALPAYIKHCRELKIPEEKINRNFYDPKIRNLHPWFARRPCSVARAITLASLLPSSTDRNTFLDLLGWKDKSRMFLSETYPPLLFYTDPRKDLIAKLVSEFTGKNPDHVTVCDPMAGGGTIPLESLRLGFNSIAVDYNPVAYLILKGTIKYPALYGRKLSKEVVEESKKLISYAKQKLGDFYPVDAEGYIIARGVNCPECGGLIPLISDTKINRSTYLRFDFSQLFKDFKVSLTRTPERSLSAGGRKGEVKCPYCGSVMEKREAYRLWTNNHVEILCELEKGIINEKRIMSTHLFLVRQTGKGYLVCNREDFSCFLAACKELARSFTRLKHCFSGEKIPDDNEVFAPLKNYGIKQWHELYNPRQLLSILTLIEYLHNRFKDVSTEGVEAATALYLAFGVSRVSDYNSIITTWKQGTIRSATGQYARGRKMTYAESYCEAIVPYRNLSWIYEPDFAEKRKTEGGICPVLDELCRRLEGLERKVSVIYGDARFLSSLLPGKTVDVINVDPPYFDQHLYSDISEYFWQTLLSALKPLIEKGLIFDKNYSRQEILSSFVPREGEIIVRGKRNSNKFDEKWYTLQMSQIFRECFHSLENNGILIVWFTHRSLEAWISLVSALYAGGFYVTRLWPVTSELTTRLVGKHNNPVLNKTLIVIARKRKERSELTISELKNYITDFVKTVKEACLEVNASEHEYLAFVRPALLCALTVIPPPENESPVHYFESKLVSLANKLAEEILPSHRG